MVLVQCRETYIQYILQYVQHIHRYMQKKKIISSEEFFCVCFSPLILWVFFVCVSGNLYTVHPTIRAKILFFWLIGSFKF